jgi:hypothetical protein
MSFVVAHRVIGFPTMHGHSMSRARRQLKNTFQGWRIPTPDERANLYASRMPTAVLGTAQGK